MPAAVSVTDLVVRRGALTAVDGLSLEIEEGEVVALLGPNGAGKTTTVESIAGLHRPSSGRIRVLGVDPALDRRSATRSVGVMTQDGGVHPGMRAIEALRLYSALHGSRDDAYDLLHLVGLGDRSTSTWRSLSGGEQQRLSLALALVGRPRVALLDEPTSGVDPAGRILLRQLVADQAGAGVAVLVTTHELAEADRMADRVVIINRGQVIAAGRPGELGGDADDLQFAVPTVIDTAALGAALEVEVTAVGPGEYRVGCPPTPAKVAALTAWLAARDIPLGTLRAGRRSLEEVYLRLMEEQP